VLYGIVIITALGYDSYTRLDAPFTPPLMIIVWGGLVAGAWQLAPARWRRTAISDQPTLALQANSAPAWQRLPETDGFPAWQQLPRSTPGLQANSTAIRQELPSLSDEPTRELPITEGLTGQLTQRLTPAPASPPQTPTSPDQTRQFLRPPTRGIPPLPRPSRQQRQEPTLPLQGQRLRKTKLVRQPQLTRPPEPGQNDSR
jgi:hypothetical protein